jgi:hypothetical protein
MAPKVGNPSLISSKTAVKFPCILEKNNAKITSKKGSFDSEVRVILQNTAHNRGVVTSLTKTRFLAGIKESGSDTLLVFGKKMWETNQTMAKVKEDSVLIDFGTEFSSDKYIELTFSTVLELPVSVNQRDVNELTGIDISGFDSVTFLSANKGVHLPFAEILESISTIRPGDIYSSTNFAPVMSGSGEFATRSRYEQTYVSAGKPTISVKIYPSLTSNFGQFFNDIIQANPANLRTHIFISNSIILPTVETFRAQYEIAGQVVFTRLFIVTVT